ncbi:MAG: hypothetical protein MGG11_07270 [Trichodesmium sp. MAG_R03]|nr:hypothetical protein [Trichodesmium sp. MAG_R03]
MPEAELPGNEHLPEINDPVNHQKLELKNEVEKIRQRLAPESHTSISEDDNWETVNSPDSISVDSIPILETTSEGPENLILTAQDQTKRKFHEVRELEVVVTKNPNEELESANLMKALHDCNRELVSRVTELETALEECQKTLENQEKLLEERTRELAATQQQVTRLFHKLELCSQIIQRQEVLVESLTDKWEKSEQHQAQMERECTLTKQSYSQQSYYLKELESSCEELRSRLYRQQQQTLQFKTALERCLEMPGRMDMGNQVVEKTTDPSSVRTSQVSSKSEPSKQENPFIQTNTEILPVVISEPVKTWSPQTKSQQKEKTLPKINLGNKLDLPQGLTIPQKLSSLEENPSENIFSTEVRESTSNASLLSFSRIGKVLDDKFVEEVSQKGILEETEAGEYVVIEENLIEEQSKSQDREQLEKNKVIEEIKKADTLAEEANTVIKHERISWNISTGKWNVCEYQPETETEINPEKNAEGLSEISRLGQQDVGQTTPLSSKVHLPTWNLPVFESEYFEEDIVSEVLQKQEFSLGAIDLPNFPKISIDDQPSAINS